MAHKTALEVQFHDLVASLDCVICGARPVQVHHIREGQGMSQRAGHFLVLPLCPDCHQGPQGIHGDRTAFRMKKWGELDALNETLRRVYGAFR